nr:hypothetical protein [Marinicella sp. W31]MDC2878328.1 hypothetical protein [Marinicella sp. W31]
MNGLKTNDLDNLELIDQLIGNYDGNTGVISGDRLIALFKASAGPTYEARAELFADLAWPAGAIASVWGDATVVFRGTYKKAGAVGTGGWARIGDLPLNAATQSALDAKADRNDARLGRRAIAGRY